jgi:hypothetical protein
VPGSIIEDFLLARMSASQKNKLCKKAGARWILLMPARWRLCKKAGDYVKNKQKKGVKEK